MIQDRLPPFSLTSSINFFTSATLLCSHSLVPDPGLRPLRWMDLVVLIWHCTLLLWLLKLKRWLSNECRGGEPQVGLSCLSKNIQHFNRQSHITGPVVSLIRVLKNAEYSFYVEKKLPLMCLCWCFMQLCCRKMSVPGSKKQEAGPAVLCVLTVIIWCDLKQTTFICLFPQCMVGQNLNHNTI